ncbi:MAG: hypothetical protein K9L68_10825 [Spirochaetales bacterium]|nr:hypothetical protein [Spirochaetales bacterium]MCF7939078.1 hypothetical protein [Spirochaetales bacterium]
MFYPLLRYTHSRFLCLFPAVFPLLIVFLFAGCGGSPPLILDSRIEVFGYQEDSDLEPVERLSVFVRVKDAQGTEDLDRMVVFSDAQELFWSAGPRKWKNAAEGDSDPLIGTSDLEMPAEKGFPRGAYRIAVYDRAGRKAETVVYLGQPRYSYTKEDFPVLEAEGDLLNIKPGGAGDLQVIGYDSEGNLGKSVTLETPVPAEIRLSSSFGEGGRSLPSCIRLIREDHEIGVRLVTGCFSVPNR